MSEDVFNAKLKKLAEDEFGGVVVKEGKTERGKLGCGAFWKTNEWQARTRTGDEVKTFYCLHKHESNCPYRVRGRRIGDDFFLSIGLWPHAPHIKVRTTQGLGWEDKKLLTPTKVKKGATSFAAYVADLRGAVSDEGKKRLIDAHHCAKAKLAKTGTTPGTENTWGAIWDGISPCKLILWFMLVF